MSAIHTKIISGDGFGWTTEDGQFLPNSRRIAVGDSPSPAVGVLVRYMVGLDMNVNWITLEEPKPQGELLPGGRYALPAEELDYPTLLLCQIRDLLIKIEKNTQPNHD